jgi:orotate phosphoribosyltransferase
MNDLSLTEPPSADLAVALAQAGLIQFGNFVQDEGGPWPVAVHLRWLPSYPALLRRVAETLAPRVAAAGADRILTTRDAIPLGTAVSLASDVAMVYPYGQVADHTAAYAIEGAYDVGHPTLLLSDVLMGAEQAQTITRLARRVGLDITLVLAVLDLDLGAREELARAGFNVEAVLTLPEMLPVLEREGWLTPALRAAVEGWIVAEREG